tara:strand:+ start:35 stop:334 length:300 start_codon:yes stop_codon:yes gene_type:complete
MMTIIILSTVLAMSMLVNIIMAWYTRKLLDYLEMTNDESRGVLANIVEYENHLREVYNKELFYGDSTLEKLLEHTTNIADRMEEFVTANEQLTAEADDA